MPEDPPLRPEVLELLSGTPYRAIERLGRGGMGEVYVVEDQAVGRRFALKVLYAHHARRPGIAERLRLEAQSLGSLEHPNVVQVVDCWSSPQGAPCLLLELLHGRTLAQELREHRRLPAQAALHIATQALAGLGAAHGLGIVHRDVKPENVFLHQTPGYEPVVKLLDFGLARVLPQSPAPPPAHGAVRTTTGAMVGSGRYTSPEGLRGERLDPRADLYAVGLLLYEMLTGDGPYDLHPSPPGLPSALVHEVPSELDSVVMRAIEQDRGARFQTAEDFLRALRAALPPSPAPWRPSPGWIGKRP